MNELVRLRDGASVVVREMRPTDADAVREGFRSLSAESLRRRFFTPAPRLTAGMLEDLTAVDPGRRLVLLAFETGTGRLLGGARAVRLRHDPGAADVAVTVGDECQGRGLGTALLRELVRAARAQGIERLRGNVLVDNGPAKRLLRAAGAHLVFDEPGVLRFELPLVRIAVAA